MSYPIEFTSQSLSKLKKIKKKDIFTANKVLTIIKILSEEPFNGVLRTHQVNLQKYGKVWSSRVTGDMRIIWRFDDQEIRFILIVDIGTHDEVY